jgi:RNA polymerase sigma-70 factor (family 1)
VIPAVSEYEKEWVRGLSENREDIFRTVYDAYQRPVFVFAYYLTKSRDMAEDVVQEVFTLLWEKRSLLNPDTFLLTYLKKMTRNKIIDIFRKAAADKKLLEKIDSSMSAAAQTEHYSPDQTLEKEMAAIYRDALDQLPPQQRLVFSLRRDENMSYKQIAERLGLSPNTVRNHLTIATRSLHRYAGQHADLGFMLAFGLFINK